MAQTQRISKNNTTVSRGTQSFSVVLHKTVIVSAEGSRVTLCTGGWNTVTTRTRMNQTANELCDGMFVVGTKKGQLSVSIGRATMARLNETGNPRPFPNVEFDRSITFDYMTGQVFEKDGFPAARVTVSVDNHPLSADFGARPYDVVDAMIDEEESRADFDARR